MEFMKTPRAFAIELIDMHGGSAAAGMEALLYAIKAKKQPGITAAWTAEVLIEIAKLREAGLAKA